MKRHSPGERRNYGYRKQSFNSEYVAVLVGLKTNIPRQTNTEKNI